MKLQMVGCTHGHSDTAIRERLSFNESQMRQALALWRDRHPDAEAVLVSTCNRVELYTAVGNESESPSAESVGLYLTDFHDVSLETVRDQLLVLSDDAAVRHLFRVAASLDSMVVGEAQIVSQIRQAYELAKDCQSAGPLTHQFFQTSLRVARRVASETALHRRRVSIPSVAIADFASRVFERFDDKRVLVIGAGKMAEETLRYLTDEGARRIVVINRNAAHAAELARRWDGFTSPWGQLYDEMTVADLVVSTTSATEPIVTVASFQERVAPARHQRPLFVLDLAMPRDFEMGVGDTLGTYLYSIDDLRTACEKNLAARRQELPHAERIIDEEARRFAAELHRRATAPVIAQLRTGLEGPKDAELRRLFNKLPNLDAKSRKEIEQFADRLVNKMLHPPIESLRDESQKGTPHGLLDALRRLFQLQDEEES